MKKIIFSVIVLFSSYLTWAQVSTTPTFITQTSCPFVLNYDASLGSAGLIGLTSGVYVHIGVITSKSTSSSDWKYVLTSWPTSASDTKANTAKNMLTYVSGNMWKLTIGPDIQTFLGVPSGEAIKQIA